MRTALAALAVGATVLVGHADTQRQAAWIACVQSVKPTDAALQACDAQFDPHHEFSLAG